MAGCVFAKDILEAFMATVKGECPEGRPWGYADVITLRVEGDTAAGCVSRMHEQLEKLKKALRRILWHCMTVSSKCLA